MSHEPYILFDYPNSSAAARVRIVLNLKKIVYESKQIHLLEDGGQQHSTAYRNINPAGLVPTLQTPKGLISQSLAIIQYLDATVPEPRLFPLLPFERAQVLSFCMDITADIHPLNNLRVLQYLKSAMSLDSEAKNAWYEYWVHRGFEALETRLRRARHVGPFCFGEQVSAADACLIPQTFNAKRFKCDMSIFPIIEGIYEHCITLPAFKDALPL